MRKTTEYWQGRDSYIQIKEVVNHEDGTFGYHVEVNSKPSQFPIYFDDYDIDERWPVDISSYLANDPPKQLAIWEKEKHKERLTKWKQETKDAEWRKPII